MDPAPGLTAATRSSAPASAAARSSDARATTAPRNTPGRLLAICPALRTVADAVPCSSSRNHARAARSAGARRADEAEAFAFDDASFAAFIFFAETRSRVASAALNTSTTLGTRLSTTLERACGSARSTTSSATPAWSSRANATR